MESKINLAQVAPVNYKVTAALVNQFVVSTTQFLNRFGTRCDRKLQLVASSMHRIETTLNILEGKLASIGSIPASAAARPAALAPHQPAANPVEPAAHADTPPEPAAQAAVPVPPAQAPASQAPAAEAPPAPKRHALKDDWRYGKYFKMVKVGVPLGAAKGKMAAEGLDPDILDLDPNSEAPPGDPPAEEGGDEANSDSENASADDFSD